MEWNTGAGSFNALRLALSLKQKCGCAWLVRTILWETPFSCLIRNGSDKGFVSHLRCILHVSILALSHHHSRRLQCPNIRLLSFLCTTQVMDRGTDLCSVCCAIDLKRHLFEKEYFGPVELGGFQDILQRQHCALCRLIVRALSWSSTHHWQPGKYPVETCYLGRQEGSSAPPALEVWFTATTSTLPDGVYGHHIVLGQILPLEVPLSKDRNMQEGVARVLESKVNISIIQGWLNSCVRSHGPRCQPASQHPTGLYLIDIEGMRIVECDSSNRYLALSYVWGNVKALRANKKNWQELQQDGSLLRLQDQIANVVNDAIKLVAALHERYLWVDSLCIVQDDPEFAQEHISHMDTIYGHALLTIVALSGKDANASLPGVAWGSRCLQQFPEVIKGLGLVSNLPELSVVESSWKTRGWTFQELILSKRCVFFTETQTYYQCRSGYFTENFDGERVRHARAIGAENPFERTITNDNAAYSSKFNIYESLVKHYSSRELSYPSDSLNAFSGILGAFSHSFGWRFISALPQDAWDLAILWRPLAGGIELHPRHKACDQAWPWQGITPTWCWTSWAGNVFWDPWRLHSYCGKEVSILPDVEQFFVWDRTGLRDIRGHQKSPSRQPIDHEQFEMQKHLSNIRNLVGERNTDITCQPLLVFRATVFNLSLFSISLDYLATRWDQKYLVWIHDNDHYHCGTLYGVNTDWPRYHDVPSCELIVLSRCR